MNRCQPLHKPILESEQNEPDIVLKWPSMSCERGQEEFASPRRAIRPRLPHRVAVFEENWTASVPELVKTFSIQLAEKSLLELRKSLLDIVLSEFTSRIEKLEANQSIVIPINTFSPEPYELLKPIFVSVQPAGTEFEAGWYDANIHTTGENQEEAVNNLKSLILDYFDSYSKEMPTKLGIEPKRQFAVLTSFIRKET